ncbi:MAG: prephenate dehydratase [Gammaproteobacteria bacterium]|nr:prephenate dehydratase [Gammaproteobacteria bacterium]
MTLDEVRKRIDAVDRDLQRLLNERADLAQRVAKIKSAETDEAPVFYRPEREAQILKRVRDENQGPLSDDNMARLFREIISCCLSLEQPLTIAYLGPAGTYTEAAVLKQFGHFATTRAQTSVDEVFREVESGSAHYGLVAVENSTEGMVNHTLDCFMGSSLNICGEVELPIHHAFQAKTTSDAVTAIYAHEQALAQCRQWLDSHYGDVPRTPVGSNAEAARIASQTEGAAAIAGEMAAERYGLRILATNIEDQPDNKTRFLVIGAQEVGPSGHDKTSILVSTRNEPGALYSVLEPFHRHGISLSRIETRPSGSGNWTYVFFIDFDGHQSSDEIKAVLADVRKVSMEVKSLGSYPQAVV